MIGGVLARFKKSGINLATDHQLPAHLRLRKASCGVQTMSVFSESKDDDGPSTHHRRGNRVRAGFPVFEDSDDFDDDDDGGRLKSDGPAKGEVEALKNQLAAMAARNKALTDELRA